MEANLTYQSISPSDFFYRNREIAGFSNPSRAIYSAIRELLENSLDACEAYGEPPQIYLRLREVTTTESGTSIYQLRIEDNGTGVPEEHIPLCFGQVFYGSKYTLKQSRGTFGLGGTITILYGQITTHKPVHVISSTGGKIYDYELMIDIQHNRPIVLKRKTLENRRKWHGTIVELYLEGDYPRAMSRVCEYLKQTAMINPYADITFVDPRGRLFRFERGTKKMPPLPREVKPHPHGIDVETLRRLISTTRTKNMFQFMMEHFQGVRKSIVERFLQTVGIDPKTKPKSLKPEDIVRLVRATRTFNDFLRPDASCLSPIGKELFETGIRKELNLDPKVDFLKVVQRKPATYSGFPFIVEAAVAYGPSIKKQNKPGITLYRFANRIPLLYDEASGVIWKVVNKNINWSTRSPPTPPSSSPSTSAPPRSPTRRWGRSTSPIDRRSRGRSPTPSGRPPAH
ncbi:DNA topoisomerase VI subunit B [Candidatus Bathyarchaeota archaeon]|nr:MAG: DNA topoisomerase VI subunit B [Candidatus Bathyarchaeota archaeon]